MNPRYTSRFAFPLAAAVAALFAPHAATATNLYWDTNGTGSVGSGAATGTWGTDAFWSTDSTGVNVGSPVLTATTTNADDLFFAAGTNGSTGTVTISGTQSAHSLNFEDGAITVSGGTAINLGSATAGSGIFFANVVGYNFNTSIILNSAATDIAFTVKGNQVVTFGSGGIAGSASGIQTMTIGGPGSSGGAMTFNGIISDGGGGGTVGVTVNGSSTYTLAAANTYTGATKIITGTLVVSNASTFSNTSAVSLGAAGRLNVNAANASLAKLATGGGGSGVVAGSFLRYSQAQTAAGPGNSPGTIFGTVELNLTNVNPNYTLDLGSGGALTNLVASIYTSALSLSGTASIDSSLAAATYSTGGITASAAGSHTLNLTGANTGANAISGNIGNGSGVIALTKGGGGTWVLSGTNTFTGNTRVDAGTLQFTNQASLYNNGAAAAWTKNNIVVGSGGTMAFNVGGAGQFTKANIVTLLGLSDSATNGFMSGASVGIDTTGGSLLFDTAITNTNGGSNVLGLTKLGTNTLTLDQNNTYTGRTIISGGTLQLGNGGTTGKLASGSTMLNNGNLTINRSDAVAQGTDFSGAPIAGIGSFTQAGSGTTTLNAANTFSGTTTVTAGTLALANALAIQNSVLVTTGAGTVSLGSVTTPTFGGLSGATGNLSTIISAGYSGVTNLTLNPLSGSVTYGGIIADGATGMKLTKNGAGTQILSGANTYTGATVVNAGVLTVGSGANGSLSSTSTLQMGGGTFNYSRTGSGQTVNGITVNAGISTVNNTSTGQTLTVGGISRTGSEYGTLNFATLTGSISTTTLNVNGIIGPWATTGATTNLKYAVGSAAGAPTNIAGLTGTAATANLANVTSATGNFEYSAAATTAADLTANTLRYSGGATTTAIGATNTLTLNGLLNAGTATLTISGGPTTGGIIMGSTNELVITANAQATTISSAIKDGGAAGTLVYNGAASTLTLSSTTSTYSGGTVINSGIVAITTPASGSLGGSIGTGPIIINSAGKLRLATSTGGVSLSRALTLNGGTLFFDGSGNNLTYGGTINLAANSTIETKDTNSGFPTISGAMSGTGGFTKVGTGGLRLNGTSNNYDGPTVVSVGGLTVKSSLYGNNTSKWTPANITVAAGGTLMLNVAGAGEFSLSDAATMFGQLATNVNNNGLLAGSTIGVDTRNAANGTYTYSSVITDSTGPGGGSVSFKHTGTSSIILELTGANTYSGTTIVDNASTLKVSSFNSVFTNSELGTVHSASSSLGAPTTVINGTIHLGSASTLSNIGNTFLGGNLTYVGTGETTDRILSLNGGGGETYILNQSGTGHLKFVSSLIMGDGRSIKTIALQGSTAGTGEIAGTIPNAGNGNNQLTKSGTGAWILSGPNLYAGPTTINANGGRLQFAKQASLYNNTESSWIKTNIIVNSGGTLAFNVGGTGEFTPGNIGTLITNLSTSINNNGLRAGSAVGFDTTNAAGGSVTLTHNFTNSTGTGSGAIGLTKLGTNALVLAGTSNYTGPTTIAAGVLAVDGSLGNTTTAVKSGATLKGSGSISGIVTIESGGSIAAGNSIGSLATGPLTLNAGSNFAYEIDNGALPAAAGDLTAVTGNFNLTSTAVLTLTELGSGAWDPGDKLTLISYSGTWNGALFTFGSPLADDSAFTFSGMQWMFNYNDTAPGSNFSGELTGSSFVTMTAVPEPGVALLAGFVSLVLLSRRRSN